MLLPVIYILYILYILFLLNGSFNKEHVILQSIVNTSIGMEEKTLLFTLNEKNPIYKHVHVLAKNHIVLYMYLFHCKKIDNLFISLFVC